jgi:glycosyltransferase involved in cell wall biosynthesis
MYSMLDLLDRIPSIELDIVGPCADERALSAEIAGRGLAHRVRLHGRLSYSRSWEIAREALAGLSLLHDTPAFRTARPTKIFEYGAVGIPVLATPLPGQAQLLADSSGGVVGNIDALASAVEDWVLDPSRARLIGRKGRSAAEIFDDGSSQRLVDAIAQLIDPGSRPDMS